MFGANWHVKKTQSECVPIRIRRRRTCGSVRSVCAAGGVEVVDSCKVNPH